MRDDAAIRELIADWHRATAAGDVDAILEMMTEDVVFLTPGHPPMSGREAFGQTLRALLERVEISSSADVVEVQTDAGLAYAWSRLTVTIAPRDGGAITRRSGNALSVLRRDADGRWLMYRDANMLTSDDAREGTDDER